METKNKLKIIAEVQLLRAGVEVNITRNQTVEAKWNELYLRNNKTDNKTNIVEFLYSDKLAGLKYWSLYFNAFAPLLFIVLPSE